MKKLLKLISVILIISICTSACKSVSTSDIDDDLIVQADKNNVLNLGMDSVDTMNPVLSKSASVRECS